MEPDEIPAQALWQKTLCAFSSAVPEEREEVWWMGWNEWGENLLVGGVKEQELVAVTGRDDLEPVKPYPFQPGRADTPQTTHPPGSVSRLKHRKLSYLNGVVGVRWIKKNFFFSITGKIIEHLIFLVPLGLVFTASPCQPELGGWGCLP